MRDSALWTSTMLIKVDVRSIMTLKLFLLPQKSIGITAFVTNTANRYTCNASRHRDEPSISSTRLHESTYVPCTVCELSKARLVLGLSFSLGRRMVDHRSPSGVQRHTGVYCSRLRLQLHGGFRHHFLRATRQHLSSDIESVRGSRFSLE